MAKHEKRNRKVTFNNKTKKEEKMAISITQATGAPEQKTVNMQISRVNSGTIGEFIHSDAVYNALMNAAVQMESRLKTSLENYQEHPDVQANLQQLQYDLQQWNLALTTMTNINKNMGDALSSIASNFR